MRSPFCLGVSLQALRIRMVGATEYTTSATSSIVTERRLGQTFLDFYEAETNVNGMTALDLDQRTMVAHLASETEAGMERARNVYTFGSYARPYAELTLADDGLSTAVKAGTGVMGYSGTGVTGFDEEVVHVKGTVMEDTDVGSKFLLVEYDMDSFEPGHVCVVGGSPNPMIEGCFPPEGTVVIGDVGTTYSYSYLPTNDNKNGLTLQGLSSQAKEVMYDCEGCPHKAYNVFFDYYGEFDYADQWIQAAFNGSSTSLKYGNADFSKFDLEARAASIRWGTVLLNVWMYVMNNLEDAVRKCNHVSDDPIESLDRAVAAYTGWEVQRNHINGGHLLFTHAQIECAKFGTCNEDGLAIVNGEIFMNFVEGKKHLLEKNCKHAKEHLKRITILMVIPLVQGVLRTAYMMDVEQDQQGMTKGQAFAFAASILPILHACNPANAALVFAYIKPGEGPDGSFHVIKDAVEQLHECLQITCEDVGGLVTLTGDGHLEDAGPCRDHTQNSASSKNDAEPSNGGAETQTSKSTNDVGIVIDATATQTYTSHNNARPVSVDTGTQASATEQFEGSSQSLVNTLFVALIASIFFGIMTSTLALIFAVKLNRLRKESNRSSTLPAVEAVPVESSEHETMESSEPEVLKMDKEII